MIIRVLNLCTVTYEPDAQDTHHHPPRPSLTPPSTTIHQHTSITRPYFLSIRLLPLR